MGEVFLRQSKQLRTISVLNTFLLLILTCGVIEVLVTEQNAGLGIIAEGLVFILIGMNGYIGYADASRRDRIAAQGLYSMHLSIEAILNQEPDDRPDPYPFAIAVDARMRGIQDQASGESIEVSQDIFEDHIFDPHTNVV